MSKPRQLLPTNKNTFTLLLMANSVSPQDSIQQLYIYFLANDTFHISTGAPFYRCTFEDDDNSCFLREDINDDFNWTRNKVNEYSFYHRWIKWKGTGAKSSTGKTYFNTLFPISSLSFLAHLAKDNVNFCHRPSSVVRRPSPVVRRPTPVVRCSSFVVR